MKRAKNPKNVIITGASSGIGYLSAQRLLERGHRVMVCARRVERMEPLRRMGAIVTPLDVTQEQSASYATVISRTMKEFGSIDVLVNNAGYGSFGPLEWVSYEEAHRQMEVNVFGAVRMIKAVLPYMRGKRVGTIINIGSIGGHFTTYFGGWYHATKHALVALTDALRMELAPLGIHAVLVEPGAIKTDWGILAAENLQRAVEGSPYQEEGTRAAKTLRWAYTSRWLSSPEVVARMIVRAVEARKPKTRYRRGRGARFFIWAHAVLPHRWFDKLMRIV